MIRAMFKLAKAIMSASAVFACMQASAFADSVENFYKGASVNMMIGSSSGGGYDLYGRLVAQYLGRHIPGSPTIIPHDMPAASGVAALRHVYSVAQNDGLTIGTSLRNTFFDPLMYPELQQGDFDPRKLVWLGSANSETTVCVSWYTSGINSFDDLKTKGMMVGGNGPSSTDVLFGRLLNAVAGTKIRPLIGYPGTSEVSLAMERGEIEGRCGLGWDSIQSLRADWLRDGKIKILVQFGLHKHPDLPNVPWIMDMAQNDTDRQVLQLYLGPNLMGRPFFGSPGMPAERAAALQKAFADTMKDPEFLANAEKLHMAIDPMTGPEVADLVDKIYAISPEALKKSRDILKSP